ncbi:MAG: protein kinase [Anaerolineae bacterium]|nr:protein kinase [Gloeobacterales cyanobacterium ES-bin-313]
MIGRLLDGRYKILQVLGAGGFSETYLAQDTRRPGSPTCVVKLLKPNTNNPNSLQISRRLFQSEAETLERLGNHSQIPRLLAYFEEDQEFYLVQEYIKGNLLSTEFTPEKPYTEEQTILLLRDVLHTLAFVHEQGVIHRDVKPDNLIRRWEDDKLVLVDFGAVKKIWNRNAAQNQVAGTIIGTPGYMATEQGRGKPRPSSDIYALGMVAVQAITGITPMSLQEDSETGEMIWQQYAKSGPGLVAIIDKMIRYHFRDRFQSAKEVLAALDQLNNAAPGFMPNLNALLPVAEEEEDTAPAHREETFFGQVFVPPAQPPTYVAPEVSPAVARDATVFMPAPTPAETSATQPSTFLVESLPVLEQPNRSAQPPTVLSAEEPTLSQLYPPPSVPEPILPQQPVVVPNPAVGSPAPQKPASKAPVLVGAGVLAALLVGTVGFFVLKPSSQNSSPTVVPSALNPGEPSSGTNPAAPESSTIEPIGGQNPENSTAATSPEKPGVQSTTTAEKPSSPSTTTPEKPTDPASVSTAEKPITPPQKPAVAAVSPLKKVAVQSQPSQPTIKPEEPEKPRKKPVLAVRRPAKPPVEPVERPKKVAIKPVQKSPTPEKKPTVVLRPVRPEGSASPFKSQSAPVNSGSSDGLKPAATPVQPPN